MKIGERKVVLKDGRHVTIRSAHAADAEAMLKHLKQSHSESYRNLNQSAQYWESVSVTDEEKILSEFESSSSKFMLVAVYEGRIVGALGFWGFQAEHVKQTAAFGMSVQNEVSGVGIGTELIKLMLLQAKEAGFHRIELTVRTYNKAGIRLYEKMGFERVGLLKETAFIDGKYVDEYSYQKLLN